LGADVSETHQYTAPLAVEFRRSQMMAPPAEGQLDSASLEELCRGRALAHEHAAVYIQHVARNVSGCVRREEGHRLRNFRVSSGTA